MEENHLKKKLEHGNGIWVHVGVVRHNINCRVRGTWTGMEKNMEWKLLHSLELRVLGCFVFIVRGLRECSYTTPNNK